MSTALLTTQETPCIPPALADHPPAHMGSTPRLELRYHHRARHCRPFHSGPRAAAIPAAARKNTSSPAIPHRQLLCVPFRIPADTGTPGLGECAGSARNGPSRELPDLYTRIARKTIVIGAPGK